LVVKQRLLCAPELHCFVVAVRQEGQPVSAEDDPLVLVGGQQDLANLRLAALHRALDLGQLEQRGVGVDGDLQLAARRLVNVVCELLQVHGVEVGGRVGRRQVPFGLGLGSSRERQRASGSDDEASCHVHSGSP
jgi:hypothetical protein